MYAWVFSLQSVRIPRITQDVNEHEKVYIIGTSSETRTFSNNRRGIKKTAHNTVEHYKRKDCVNSHQTSQS